MSQQKIKNKVIYAKAVIILESLLQKGLIDQDTYIKINKLCTESCR